MNPVHQESTTPLTEQWLNYEDPIAAYRGNPLIGALGPIRTKHETLSLLTRRPEYDCTERKLPDHLRAHAVCALRRLFIPNRAHEAVVREVDLLLRQGYIHRNPLDRTYQDVVRQDTSLLKRGTLPPPRYALTPLLGSAAIGTAGTGKSVACEIAIGQHPQTVHHCYNTNGVRVAFTQVVWLKLNLFQDASLKALGIEFFEKLGEAVDQPLRRDWGVDRCNANTIQPAIYTASREFNVGLLVVDEVQNISVLGAGYQQVLRYFTRMMNCLGLPILIIGTNATAGLLRLDLSVGRRFIGGIPAFTPFKMDNVWRHFLGEVWKLQYVRESSDPDVFSKLVHELTGGVPDLVIKLYMLAQIRLFGRKCEAITEPVLRETAGDLFSVVKDRLLELKGKRPEGQGIAKVREASDRHFERLANQASRSAGAQPVFPDAVERESVAVVNAANEGDSSPNVVLAAGRTSDIKSALGAAGVLENLT